MYTLLNHTKANKSKGFEGHKKDISQNDIINFTLRPNQGFSADSMRLANVERVHVYLVPNSCMQIVRCRCRKVAYVTMHANARNVASAALEHAAVEK